MQYEWFPRQKLGNLTILRRARNNCEQDRAGRQGRELRFPGSPPPSDPACLPGGRHCPPCLSDLSWESAARTWRLVLPMSPYPLSPACLPACNCATGLPTTSPSRPVHGLSCHPPRPALVAIVRTCLPHRVRIQACHLQGAHTGRTHALRN